MAFLKVNLIEIITLVFSTLAIILSWKNRKNVLRENLYDRQLNLMSEVYSMLVELEEALMHWGVTKKYSRSEEELKEMTEKVDLIIKEIDKKFATAQLVLPDSVSQSFSKTIDYFFFLNLNISLKKVSDINVSEMSDQLHDLSNVVRDFIGLEKLSSINQRVIKT